MVYTIILLLLFVIAIILRNFKNHYAWRLAIMALGLSMIVASHLFIISKRGNYPQPLGFFSLDYWLYVKLTSISIYYDFIFDINNWGTAMFSAMIPLFVNKYIHNNMKYTRWQRVAQVAHISVFPLIYVLFYSPISCYLMYLQLHRSRLGYNAVALMIKITDLFMNIMLLGYLTIPMLMLLWYSTTTHSLFTRRRTNVLNFCLCMLSILFGIIYFGPIQRVYFLVDNLSQSLLKHGFSMNYFAAYNKFVPFLMLTAMLVMFFCLVHYHAIDTSNVFRDYIYSKPIESLNRSLRDILHSFKNAFFTYQILINKLRDNYGTPEGLEILDRLTQVNDNKLDEVTKALNSVQTFYYKKERCNIDTCIGKAIKQCEPPKNIRISKGYNHVKCYVHFDEFRLVEVFVNLIQNAIEAIQGSRQPSGSIVIDIIQEHQLVITKVTDDGPGMNRILLKKIFDPFYSTKAMGHSWGLGLSYVEQAVRTQYGVVTVQSQLGKGTSFEIILPEVKGSEG